MPNKQKITITILVLLALVGAGGVLYALFTTDSTTSQVSSRPKSEAVVEDVVEGSLKPLSQQEPTSTQPNSIEEISFEELMDTSTWKTYENEDLGVRFRYPEDWNLNSPNDAFKQGKTGTITISNSGIAIRLVFISKNHIFDGHDNPYKDFYKLGVTEINTNDISTSIIKNGVNVYKEISNFQNSDEFYTFYSVGVFLSHNVSIKSVSFFKHKGYQLVIYMPIFTVEDETLLDKNITEYSVGANFEKEVLSELINSIVFE